MYNAQLHCLVSKPKVLPALPALHMQCFRYSFENMRNKQMLSLIMLKNVPKLSPGYTMATYAHLEGKWPDCLSFVTRVVTTVMSQ